MSVIAVTSFSPSSSIDEAVQNLAQALESSHSDIPFVIGTKIQNSSLIQITSEWPGFQTPADLQASSTFHAFENIVRTTTSSQITTLKAFLDTSPFKAGNPPLVEFVNTSFLAAEVTPEIQDRTRSDFARFEAIYRKRGTPKETGEIGIATGWTEEQNGVRGFLVVRGWTGMDKFEEAIGTEIWKEGIPILLRWGKPFELWHVERKSVNQWL